MAVKPKVLLDTVVTALDDGKAVDIKVLDVRKLTAMADYMVVATGRSSRQVKALADQVEEAARALGVKPLGVEGQQGAEWILVDLNDVICHVMQAETREFYQIEKLWTPLPKTRKDATATGEVTA